MEISNSNVERPVTSIEGSTVLIVDDEAPLRQAYARILEQSRATVHQAADADAAMRALSANTYDVILTDIILPKTDGIQLLAMIREQDPNVPIILVTGNPTVESAARAIEHGALQYLTKPLDRSTLVAAVRSASNLRRLAQSGYDASQASAMRRLDRALQGLRMVYQPIVNPTARRIIGYEALVRSMEPTLPHPEALFATAARLNRLWDVGRAIRKHVARTLRDRKFAKDVFVNLHSADLLDESLFREDASLAPFSRRIIFEITERTALQNDPDMPKRVARLRALGYRVAIDDLATGYSGLSYFAIVNPDIVKLDIDLVRSIDRDAIKQKLVHSVTRLCKQLDILLVAEGVETRAECDTLIELGCPAMQGYLFAKPDVPFPDVDWDGRDATARPLRGRVSAWAVPPTPLSPAAR